ncbi:MAG: Na/Pi cotransporter family protein [Oscillospiraceae bacterium]
MNYFFLLDMLGGLALFLYGMSMLGGGLEKVSGGRLEKTLEKLSNNIFKAVLLGALVTAAVQSSSATTVIVVGLVNANIIKLKPAIGVIMGANVGTTITAHILRLSSIESDNIFMTMLKPNTWAPIILVIGVFLYMGAKKTTRKDIGQILLGFGLLFMGMFAMSDAVEPLSQLPIFAEAFAKLSNPIAGVVVGALVTAIIQSSSASVGILQALASTGIITFSAAFPIIMGQNIGTCITPILASIGASKNAKRSAFVHLSFNIVGTIIFLVGIYAFQTFVGFPFWGDVIDSGGIANFHTIFNVTITLLLIPFAGLLEKLAIRVIKSGGNEEETDATDAFAELDTRFFVSPGLAIEHAKRATYQMGLLSEKNYKRAVGLFKNYDLKRIERIKETENIIDTLDTRISGYLVQLSSRELTEVENQGISALLQVCSEIERIGDYAVNVMECAEDLFNRNAVFSESAYKELQTYSGAIDEIIQKALTSFKDDNEIIARGIEPLEEVIDRMENSLKHRHLERIKKGQCSVDAGYPFVDCIAHLERIADHCSNIGISIVFQSNKELEMDKHEYSRQIGSGCQEFYTDLFNIYEDKYLKKINAIAEAD